MTFAEYPAGVLSQIIHRHVRKPVRAVSEAESPQAVSLALLLASPENTSRSADKQEWSFGPNLK